MAEPQAQAASHSLEQLPVEILQDIFCYFDITDIVCIRRISRYFNEVTRSREVWSDAYRRAGFIRPPGPFPTQTSNELERALVTSFKVDRNLRCGNARRGTPVVTSQEIRYTGVDLHVCLLFGKYLVIAFSDEVRCYNVDASDSESGPYIVFKPSGILKSFQCFSSTDGEGRPLACAIIHEIIRTPSERARQA
ncbi:hypothetical protein HYDPIDRAFT_105137 [Hydnomerulius pinastri MD-312]|nr:hypothetical protein HYDPIDRAFT_105137 [Hydnomerulius pinastri MD-312]